VAVTPETNAGSTRATNNSYEPCIRRYIEMMSYFCLSRRAETARVRPKGSAMPRPPDLFDTPSEPRGATRLAQGLLIVAIMVLIVIARLSTH
jgi:hypothetical protein